MTKPTPRAEDTPAASQPNPERKALPGATEAGGSAWQQNFVTRVAVGVPVAVGVLLLIALAPLKLLALVVAAVGVYGTYEFVRLVQRGAGTRLPMGPLLFAATAIGLGGLMGTALALNAGLLVGVLLLVWSLWFSAPADERDALREAGLALGGLLLVPWLINHLGLLVQLPGGRGFLAFLIVACTLNDTLAYLVGTFLGRWPLIPTVSPHKTVEGAVGGVAGGVLGGVLARAWMGDEPVALSLMALVLLGAVLAVAAQAGDLLESKLKRLTHAADSGRLLPGHGGLLDRVDAYLLVAPLSFYLLTYLGD
jgi:phosphatidate cytidylyltransferase